MTVGDVPLDRGVCLSLGTLKTAKGPQSRAPSAHPLGFFLVVQGIRCSYLLTCVCMLRYSARYAVPMLFYFFTFSVVLFWQGVCILRYSVRYAVPMLFYFFTFFVVLFWQGARILRYSARYAMPILFYFFTFSVVRFWQGARILRYSAHHTMPMLFYFFAPLAVPSTFTPSDTTPKHPPYKPQAAHKPPAAAQPVSWNCRPYKPRSTPYSAPYQ